MKRLVLVFLASVALLRADFRWAEKSVAELQAEMAAGRVTSEQLTQDYLARVAEIDRAGPKLNAVLELNPDALAIARERDAERRAGKVRGPLHGVPFLVKDNLDTADRMQTTAGSLALVGQRVPRDAHVVAQLRAAGAVLLGKANMTEWANFRGNNSSSGWSGRGGQTRNPYALDRNPSGSSSGSAAAVSANLCAFAIGTETNGSIVSPASACGVVGFKPTVGLVSRSGIIPIAASQDTAGPIARSVADAALVLAAIAGPDERDDATREIPRATLAELTVPLPAHALRGARIGVVRGPFGIPARLDGALDHLVAQLRAAGAEVTDDVKIATLGKFGGATYDVLSYEFKDGLNRYLAEPGRVTPMKMLADVIAFNEAHAAEEMAFFGQQDLVAAEKRGPLTERAYLDALATCRRLARGEGLDATFAAGKFDALVMLTRGPAALTDHVLGESSAGGSSTMAAVAGYPSVTVPAAEMFGLPVGASFVGRAWDDAKLLALAADFETRTHARRAPEFLSAAKVP
ncbi:MAG: amidase [Candidatus Didemnitutus sp.]|nr:amidase [Candidatus Didemnitutus sp.]